MAMVMADGGWSRWVAMMVEEMQERWLSRCATKCDLGQRPSSPFCPILLESKRGASNRRSTLSRPSPPRHRRLLGGEEMAASDPPRSIVSTEPLSSWLWRPPCASDAFTRWACSGATASSHLPCPCLPWTTSLGNIKIHSASHLSSGCSMPARPQHRSRPCRQTHTTISCFIVSSHSHSHFSLARRLGATSSSLLVLTQARISEASEKQGGINHECDDYEVRDELELELDLDASWSVRRRLGAGVWRVSRALRRETGLRAAKSSEVIPANGLSIPSPPPSRRSSKVAPSAPAAEACDAIAGLGGSY